MSYPIILENEIKIQSYLLDDKMQLSLPSLFGLIQEVSSEHVDQCEIGWHQLKQKNLFWVLSKIKICIERLPKWSEKVVLRTWGKWHDMAVEPRDYEMIDENGEVIIKGTSSWVILDANTGKIQNLMQFEEHLVFPEGKNAIDERAGKVQKIDIPDSVDYEHVRNSDLDMNQHVNNSKYIQWAIDSINRIFTQTHKLKEAAVNYLSQAKIGDFYNIVSQQINPNVFVTSIFEITAKREFCRIESKWENLEL